MVLALTETQARSRSSVLVKRDAGFEVLAQVQFKKGERVGVVSGNIPKAMLSFLQSEQAGVEPATSESGDRDYRSPDVRSQAAQPIKTK
jgi:hypothetical protein